MNVEEINNPGYDEPKKSGRSWFACFGIGCLVLFLLCALGAVITWFAAGDYIYMAIEQGKLHAESIQVVMENDDIKEKLGSPIQPGFAFPEQIPGEDGSMTQKFVVPLNGSSASGTLNVEYMMNPGEPVKRTVFNVEIDGEVIDLLDFDGFGLDIDDGGMEDMEDEGAEAEVSEEEPVGAGAGG